MMKDSLPSTISEFGVSEGPLKRDIELLQRRPTVPGKVIEYIYLPARGFMAGRLLKKEQVIRVVDLEGQQCFDCIMWDANNLDNVLNCMHTQLINGKWDKWRPGDAIYSKNCDKLAIITEDTTDGMHAALGAFCNEAYYRFRVGTPGRPNCRDNFVAAMAAYNFSAMDIDWGSCISFFMPVFFNADGSVTRGEVQNKPGDYIDLMAEMNIIVAISNCPSETALHAYNPTPLQAVIFDPNEDYKAKANTLSGISR